ncbi:MAG: imidazole glycerol phosphate synthase subunit HisH [Lachnospiraceae bacterium]|nr:imidazole glycerol phosphate synthase subunit HisH [Lachnospiraceae bacterium]
MIAIIDYDAGNIKSVEKALMSLSKDAIITRDKNKIMSADHVILPGVGNFADAMEKLSKYELVPVIDEVCKKGTPFLGICLGLQLMFESSEEAPGVKGLSILKGNVVKIPEGEYKKIPHMGWNDLTLKGDGRLFKDINDNPYVYFVHSYYLKAEDESIVKATTNYNVLIHASVEKDNIFACQYHPEKSSDVGLKMLKNFVEIK